MADILKTARFDAGVQTPDGRRQFSATDTAGGLIMNREYRESFDKFKSGCTCGDSYVWRVLSAVADETGLVLYDNVKNYIDYVTNVDLCKVQSLRSMVKMYGLEYKVFDRLDLLPAEILDLINVFSVNKKHLLYGGKLLSDYIDALSAAGVVRKYGSADDAGPEATQFDRILDCDCLNGGEYRQFMVDSFSDVLSGFLSLPYEEGGSPIYSIDGERGIYEDIRGRRDRYARQYAKGTVEYDRRQYKVLNGVPLRFDECAALDRIEAGMELESDYQGFELRLIQMERELRQRPYSGDKTSRYAFYKKQRVLEYANFVTDKYFSDHKYSGLSAYDHDSSYFEVMFDNGAGVEDPGKIYRESGKSVISKEDGKIRIDSEMVRSVAESLADTSLYISRIREKIKLQTRKNYMKGTYDLMLYVINEFLVDYSRLNPMFRDLSPLSGSGKTVKELLMPVYSDLSAHDINNLTAIEYFDETEYYNISAATDGRSDIVGTNDRFWRDPAGEPLMRHDGIDRDFDAESIKSFYMDTLGIRDNYISDDAALCAFLDAVFNLGAVDSFVHGVSADVDGNVSAHELFGAQVEKYGMYSDDLYGSYLAVKRAWRTFTSYLSGNEYDYQTSSCVSAQVLSAAGYIRQLILDRELSSVSAVYDAYIDRADRLSAMVDSGVEKYNDLISGEYAFYFQQQSGYKYCFDDFGNSDSYKHEWYVGSKDVGLEYWYDMIQAVDEYASGSDDKGDYITNWPIRDTVEYFYHEFTKLSGWYADMIMGVAVPDIDMSLEHDWEDEYGFVDINAPSLEDELKYGYDFMNQSIAERKQYLLDMLNNLKQQALQLQSLSQSIKNALAQAKSSYNDHFEKYNLGDSVIYAVSVNKQSKIDDEYPFDRCHRKEGTPPAARSFDEDLGDLTINNVKYYYYTKINSDGEYTGDFGFEASYISPYSDDDSVLDRCRELKQYMSAPTHFVAVGSTADYRYGLMDEGVYAAVTQVENDFNTLQQSVNGLIDQVEALGYQIGSYTDVDEAIAGLIEVINQSMDESIIEKDDKIQTYRKYLKAVIQLSSLYLPVKYEYDSISKDQKQRAYLSEFTPDNDMTLAALGRLSAYSVEKDHANKEAILESVARMRRSYDDAVSAYQEVAEELAREYMLPQSFQPYTGYIEEMVQLMYDALRNDVDEKIWHAHGAAEDEYASKIAPAAEELIARLAHYAASAYRLPDAVSRRLRELYYFDEPSYLRQKEMFLTYGGRSFCYYPYYNIKNVVHSSYQVHPFLWNFIRRESVANAVRKTFYSVNVDELERHNIAQNWRKFFGDYGESKYLDLSKPRYPDYSGYQSRYEDSNHVADNTQFVSEVVDYDGAFYPPAVEWLRENGLPKAVQSIKDAQYNKKIAEHLRGVILGLSSLDWGSDVLPALLSSTEPYCVPEQVSSLSSYVWSLPGCYDSGARALSDITPYEVYSAVNAALSGESTFYGRFYRQLRLDQDSQRANKEYIINQLSCYWGSDPVPGGGPSISAITNDATLDRAFDIYRYGMDSYGNMYCLYKQYDPAAARAAAAQGGLSYKRRRSTPGSLWIRLKNHPLAFPAFSGSYPNVYMETDGKRHVAFRNLLNLCRYDPERGETSLSGDEVYEKLSADGAAEAASCIYDFEFTKNRNDVTFVTKMHNYDLTCDSGDVQCYENPWLVHCRPEQETLSSQAGVGRTVLKLYSPAGETDYYWSGDNYLRYSKLSSEDALSGGGVTLYQYIGSYLKGDSGIYHAYVMQHVYRGVPDDGRYMTSADAAACVTREVIDDIRILPSINGKFSEEQCIEGSLTENSGLVLTGSDVCLAYDEENNVVNFAAQTVLAPSAAVSADSGLIVLSSNADGATIDDPGGEMNSHDIFDTNVTFFRKHVVSHRLKDVRGSGSSKYEFNTNADMSYFPVYPGLAGAKKLYARPQYEHYCVELLGMAKDISKQISYVNPRPDPYLDADAILSGFANARVYQDYVGYVDETFKTVDNSLIGANSDALVKSWRKSTNSVQQVVYGEDFLVWQIGVDKLYKDFDPGRAMKLKVLMFSRKCYGKNPYLFADVSALAGGWVDLNYDAAGDDFDGYSVISAADYVFGYGNRVLAQSTADGVKTTSVGDSNHIYNVRSVQARLVTDETASAMTLEFKFDVADRNTSMYTYVPAGQLQVAFLDVRNLDVFNYFHYLDAYGALRFLDFFKTREYINRFLTKRGAGYTIYYRGREFTEEELMNRLRSYYEYMARMVPLSGVDLSQYDSLSDVYILQGSRRLQFKVDEEFRYELDHPGYFYPTLNSKFPLTPAQYAMQMTSFKENAATDLLAGLFGQNNLFLLDMEDPAATLSSIGRMDIPILLDDQEYAFAYEDYTDYAEGELSSLRNCDLYDTSDSRALQFVQFEADAADGGGVPAGMASSGRAFEIPDSLISAVGVDAALARIQDYAGSDAYGVDGVVAACAETGVSGYAREYIGFTVDGGSLSREQVEELSRIYVNYRKCENAGGKGIQLYFNYMNYLNSPYLCVRDGRVYVDLVDNTYLSLKPDEDGVLDVVTQFRYYKGGTLCGYRNVKLASYRIYNISDDKPKFLIKNVDRVRRGDGSNQTVQPLAAVRVGDVSLDVSAPGGEGGRMAFDVVFGVEASAPLKQVEFYLDYPSELMEFTASSGGGWTLDDSQPGYAKIKLDPSAQFASIPARTVRTKSELNATAGQSAAMYIDEPVVVGANGLLADLQTSAGRINIVVDPAGQTLNLLLTDSYSSQPTVNVFSTEPPRGVVKGLILEK